MFNGIENLLDMLRNKEITQGIVTSKTTQELKDDFEPFGLMRYLPYVVCADDTKKHKPHPEPLLKFLEISNAHASSSIYIGDTMYDFACAREAGVDFALALWGCKQHEHIPAKYKLNKPSDILDLIV